MITIRFMKEGDEEHLRNICLETTEMYIPNETKIRSLWLRYIDYYYKEEPHNVLVACKEDDIPVGYLVFCDNQKGFFKKIKKEYLPQIAKCSHIDAFVFFFECVGHILLSHKYPAHLHIDIKEQYQHMGIGTTLMNSLFEHMKDCHIKGVHLATASSNKKGNAFYQKYKFKKILSFFGCTIYGKQI